ncbi:MAG: TolC family protein, partial [Burkholderiaceae bacterium]
RTHLLAAFAGHGRSVLLAQQLEWRQQILRLLDKRLALGAASATEAQQARAALEQSRLELAQADQRVQDAWAGVAAALGLPLASIRHADIRLDGFGSEIADLPTQHVREQALHNRADVQAALAAYEASQAALQLEVANQYPDLHLGPGYSYDAGARKFALSLSGIPLPLFNRNEGPIAEAEARRKEAEARFNAVQAQSIEHADQATQRYRAAVATLQVSDSLWASQQQQLAAARKAFAFGATDRLSLALAELDAGSARLAHEDALARLQSALGEIEDAMQRPLNVPFDPRR